jgi:phosphomannomutase
MPCNGTKVYTWDVSKQDFVCQYSVDIKSYLEQRIGSKDAAKQKFNLLISSILSKQIELINEIPELEVSGNFLSYRGSMLNWSMIGRDADTELRAKFKDIDSKLKIREKLHNSLVVHMNASGLVGIECALGGTTSIDIYPKGWDKTHALKHIPGSDVWFWGDSCGENGNDRALWEALGPGVKSFEISGPDECIESLRTNLPIDWYCADARTGGLDVNSTTGSD